MYVKIGVKHPLISDKIPSFGKLQTAGKNTEKKWEFYISYKKHISEIMGKMWRSIK